MLHQRRLPLRLVSTKSQPQPGHCPRLATRSEISNSAKSSAGDQSRRVSDCSSLIHPQSRRWSLCTICRCASASANVKYRRAKAYVLIAGTANYNNWMLFTVKEDDPRLPEYTAKMEALAPTRVIAHAAPVPVLLQFGTEVSLRQPMIFKPFSMRRPNRRRSKPIQPNMLWICQKFCRIDWLFYPSNWGCNHHKRSSLN